MDSLDRGKRIALICVAGFAVIGGSFMIYNAYKKRIATERLELSTDGTAAYDAMTGNDVDWKVESEKPIDYQKTEKQETTVGDKTTIKFPVQVFVRFRPLIKQEIEAKDEAIVYNVKHTKKTDSFNILINDITKKERPSAIRRKKKSKKADKIAIKKFTSFKSILSGNDDNQKTFSECILPSIDNLFKGYTVCSFAYGHTGSGKTHTILGYDAESSPGIYRLTAQYICNELANINRDVADKAAHALLSCRFAELYQGKMRDLFGGCAECHVREDEKGNIHIRGPTLKDKETGQVKVAPLTPVYVTQDNVNALIEKVNDSLKLRKQGSSAVHDESSRSHVFLEMEFVTNELIAARTKLWNAEAELVPVGKLQTDLLIEIQMGQYVQNPETGKYEENKDFVVDKEKSERWEQVHQEFTELSNKVKECENEVENVMKNSVACIGGTIVFVDLAGNEWAGDSKYIKNETKIQASERKEINQSLLSLKECVRALHSHQGHVTFRNSKLTMVLRPHLKGINSTAIMIANVSPSAQHIQKTYNTLSYSQMLAKA